MFKSMLSFIQVTLMTSKYAIRKHIFDCALLYFTYILAHIGKRYIENEWMKYWDNSIGFIRYFVWHLIGTVRK